MTDRILNRCQLLVDNRNVVKQAFSWDYSTLWLCAASVYTMHGRKAELDSLRRCKELLHQRVGAFNNFRSLPQSALCAMLDLSERPEETLEKALTVYGLLKDHFITSEYLPVAAMIIAQGAKEDRYAELAEKTRAIYLRMRDSHPFLTGGDDCAFCALLALSGRDVDELMADMEASYSMAKNEFFLSNNGVQGLSHALSLYDGTPQQKMARTMSLYNALKTAGQRWGGAYELPTLGFIAMSSDNEQQLVADILEATDWLYQQKGFGFWSMISRPQRLMYAGLMVQSAGMPQEDAANTAALSGTISAVIAEQITICVMAAAAASASSSH